MKANGVDAGAQQSMIDTAGSLVNNIPGGLSYYSRCWAIIGIITLNGDIAKAAVNIGISDPTPPAPTPSPSTPIATSAPTDRPGECKSWCAGNGASWETKCGWINCSKCDKCNVISTQVPSSIPSSIPSVTPSSSALPSTTSTPTVESDDSNVDYSELLELLKALFPILQALIDLLNGFTGFTSMFGF